MADSDRISSLPDSVLCHILSFLPTKLAVSTSVLSKRWKSLWLSVPALDFDDEDSAENNDTYVRFLLFVYSVMLSRDATQPINRFRLECSSSSLCDPSNVNKWVNYAMRRKVQHLMLSLPSSINLPSSVLSSTTLVVMKLTGSTVNAVTVSSFGFRSLKTLHLKRVHFPDRRHLRNLLFGCPVLEDLLIELLEIRDSSVLTGEFKSLPNLIRADIVGTKIPLKAINNVEFLRIEVMSNYFRNVTPVFHNLTHLEIILLPYYCDWMVKVLYHCPKLQTLLVKKWGFIRPICQDETYPQTVPKCLSRHLRTCSLGQYEGGEDDLQFARYIMQNARVLRNMKICSSSSSDSGEKLVMLKELSLCPRSSAACELSFE